MSVAHDTTMPHLLHAYGVSDSQSVSEHKDVMSWSKLNNWTILCYYIMHK